MLVAPANKNRLARERHRLHLCRRNRETEAASKSRSACRSGLKNTLPKEQAQPLAQPPWLLQAALSGLRAGQPTGKERTMFKSKLLLVLAACLPVALAGCSGGGGASSGAGTPAPSDDGETTPAQALQAARTAVGDAEAMPTAAAVDAARAALDDAVEAAEGAVEAARTALTNAQRQQTAQTRVLEGLQVRSGDPVTLAAAAELQDAQTAAEDALNAVAAARSQRTQAAIDAAIEALKAAVQAAQTALEAAQAALEAAQDYRTTAQADVLDGLQVRSGGGAGTPAPAPSDGVASSVSFDWSEWLIPDTAAARSALGVSKSDYDTSPGAEITARSGLIGLIRGNSDDSAFRVAGHEAVEILENGEQRDHVYGNVPFGFNDSVSHIDNEDEFNCEVSDGQVNKCEVYNFDWSENSPDRIFGFQYQDVGKHRTGIRFVQAREVEIIPAGEISGEERKKASVIGGLLDYSDFWLKRVEYLDDTPNLEWVAGARAYFPGPIGLYEKESLTVYNQVKGTYRGAMIGVKFVDSRPPIHITGDAVVELSTDVYDYRLAGPEVAVTFSNVKDISTGAPVDILFLEAREQDRNYYWPSISLSNFRDSDNGDHRIIVNLDFTNLEAANPEVAGTFEMDSGQTETIGAFGAIRQ